MANEQVYVVALGAEPPRRVVVKHSLGDCLELAQDAANAGLAETVTVFEVNAKDGQGRVCIPLVADGGLTPLALDMGAQQSSRQLKMQLEPTAINPAMR
jgi:hypothetical protein